MEKEQKKLIKYYVYYFTNASLNLYCKFIQIVLFDKHQ